MDNKANKAKRAERKKKATILKTALADDVLASLDKKAIVAAPEAPPAFSTAGRSLGLFKAPTFSQMPQTPQRAGGGLLDGIKGLLGGGLLGGLGSSTPGKGLLKHAPTTWDELKSRFSGPGLAYGFGLSRNKPEGYGGPAAAPQAAAKVAGLGMLSGLPQSPTGPDTKSLLMHALGGAGMGALGGGIGALFNKERSLGSVLKGALGTGAMGGMIGGGSNALVQLLQKLQAGGGAAPAAPEAPAAPAVPQLAAKPAPTPGAGAEAAAKAAPKPEAKPEAKPAKEPAEKTEATKDAHALLKFAKDSEKATETEGGTLASASDTPARPAAEKKPEEKDSENESKKKGDE